MLRSRLFIQIFRHPGDVAILKTISNPSTYLPSRSFYVIVHLVNAQNVAPQRWESRGFR